MLITEFHKKHISGISSLTFFFPQRKPSIKTNDSSWYILLHFCTLKQTWKFDEFGLLLRDRMFVSLAVPCLRLNVLCKLSRYYVDFEQRGDKITQKNAWKSFQVFDLGVWQFHKSHAKGTIMWSGQEPYTPVGCMYFSLASQALGSFVWWES